MKVGGSGGKRYDKYKDRDLSYLCILFYDFAPSFTKKAYFRWILSTPFVRISFICGVNFGTKSSLRFLAQKFLAIVVPNLCAQCGFALAIF